MKCIIYKIKCNITGEFYIGSSDLSLENRMLGHLNLNRNTYKSKQIIERGDFNYKIIDNLNVDNKQLRLFYESLYILCGKKTGKCINKIIPYSNNNIKKFLKQQYHNREDIKLRRKERDSKLIETHRTQKREWYRENKDKVNQQRKLTQQKTYAKNKHKFNIEITCDRCGSVIIGKYKLKRHYRTDKCINLSQNKSS